MFSVGCSQSSTSQASLVNHTAVSCGAQREFSEHYFVNAQRGRTGRDPHEFREIRSRPGFIVGACTATGAAEGAPKHPEKRPAGSGNQLLLDSVV